MSPFRWDVLVTGFVLAVPVLALGLRGELSAAEVSTRLVWCLAAGWGAVALIRWASAPRHPLQQDHPDGAAAAGPVEQPADGEPATP